MRNNNNNMSNECVHCGDYWPTLYVFRVLFMMPVSTFKAGVLNVFYTMDHFESLVKPTDPFSGKMYLNE